ncbi:MAG: hypothetical protein KBC64_06655 [Simkaniaceae bacterium]|nr:hypothetical protein [Simkaniaceae bacterium]
MEPTHITHAHIDFAREELQHKESQLAEKRLNLQLAQLRHGRGAAIRIESNPRGTPVFTDVTGAEAETHLQKLTNEVTQLALAIIELKRFVALPVTE